MSFCKEPRRDSSRKAELSKKGIPASTVASSRQRRVFRERAGEQCWGLQTVLLSLGLKLNGSELTEILETGSTESKYCQIPVPGPRSAMLRGNEALEAWCQYKISNRLYSGIRSCQTKSRSYSRALSGLFYKKRFGRCQWTAVLLRDM